MKRTSLGVLLVVAVAGGAAGFLVDYALTATGRHTFSPSPLLGLMAALLGVGVVITALPIRRATTGKVGPDGSPVPVDPFRALRVAMLAKASSIMGAVITGFAGGLLTFVLTRPVAPSLGSTGAALAVVAGGLVLVVAALYAEHLCTIRKDDDDDDQPGPDEPGYGLSHHD